MRTLLTIDHLRFSCWSVLYQSDSGKNVLCAGQVWLASVEEERDRDGLPSSDEFGSDFQGATVVIHRRSRRGRRVTHDLQDLDDRGTQLEDERAVAVEGTAGDGVATPTGQGHLDQIRRGKPSAAVA
jgi:hypothetical protein